LHNTSAITKPFDTRYNKYHCLIKDCPKKFPYTTPEIPLEAFDTFRNCLRHARPETAMINSLKSIIQNTQVLNSRLRGLNEQQSFQNFSRQQLPFVCGIRAITENLFDFARDKSEEIQRIKMSKKELLVNQMREHNDMQMRSFAENYEITKFIEGKIFEYNPYTNETRD